MVSVKDINWISKEAREAEVLITDGQFELLCFGHPFAKMKGEQLKEPLYALDVDKIVRLGTPNLRTERLGNAFEYLIEGKLSDKKLGYVNLGNIIIEVDKYLIPKDLKDNEYISFKCARLDVQA